MRLHSSENLAPSIYRGLTNIHLSPSYNGGNSQANSNKNVGLSTTIPSTDGTSSNVGNSASSSSLSTSILVNGHAIPMADKSMMSPGHRHVTDVRTFASRSTIKEQSGSANSSEGRVYTWSNYSNADQSAIVKSDSRGPPRSEQSPSMISGQQICADVRGISRQDQSMLSNMDSSSASQTDANTSSHADSCSAGALRIEQPIIAALSDGRVMTRSEQSTNILLADDLHDLRGARQPDQSTTIRRTSMTNEDQRATRQQPEQSANIRVAEDLARGMRQSEQSTNVRASEDLRVIRQQSEQSTSVRPQEDLRTPRAEQSINTASLLDLRGVSRSQQNTSVPLTDSRAVVFRSEQSTVIPLTDGRTIPIVEHMSPVALSDSRSNIPRISQTAASLSNQAIAASIPGQSVTQPGSSVVLTEDINHSEEPLPPGWEMRYDLYGRR